jgi:hypothetical protein
MIYDGETINSSTINTIRSSALEILAPTLAQQFKKRTIKLNNKLIILCYSQFRKLPFPINSSIPVIPT